MNKKLIAIIAVAAAILIIAVIALVSVGNKVEPAGKDLDVKAGVEDSIFDDEAIDGDDTSSDSSKDNDNSDIADSNDKNTSNSNDSKDKDDNKDGESQSDSGSTVKPGGKMTYEAFHSMSPSKQQAYMESFDDIDKFFKWYNKAKKQYEKEHPDIEIEGGPVELE